MWSKIHVGKCGRTAGLIGSKPCPQHVPNIYAGCCMCICPSHIINKCRGPPLNGSESHAAVFSFQPIPGVLDLCGANIVGNIISIPRKDATIGYTYTGRSQVTRLVYHNFFM